MIGAARAEVADAVCMGCGCLCDDIGLTADGGRIVAARNACPLGESWLLTTIPPGPDAWLDGRPAAAEAAVARAAAILRGARCPVVVGLPGATLEAQREAVAIAERIGASVDSTLTPAAAHGLAAFQRVGKVGASLGEVRNRADVVVYWGVDPAATHPRHFERHIDRPGRFVAGKRILLAAGAEPTATSARADRSLTVPDGRDFEALRLLRALARGLDPTDDEIRSSSGIEPAALREVFAVMAGARYGAFFHSPSALGSPAAAQEALELVRDLNTTRRFVALTLGGPGNAAGAEAVLTWRAGAPRAVDYARGSPRFLPGEADAETRLARGEADAALHIGMLGLGLGPEASRRLEAIPRVVVAPAGGDRATVGLAAARAETEAGGTVIRADGVTLPLRPALSSPRPSEHAWLERIRAALDHSSRD